ncbi:MAG: GNAT family N-acetyltransferase [Actinomycetota bacterium]
MPDPVREASTATGSVAAATFRRAIAFQTSMEDSAAERTEDLTWGRALFNDAYNLVYDLNLVRVDRAGEGVTADAIAREAERLHTAAGHEHRRVEVSDPELGASLAEGFRDLGWQVRRFLFMAQLREPDGPPLAPVRELEEAEHREAKRWFMATAPEAYDDEVVDQLLDRDRLKDRIVDFRRFGVEADGIVASVCELYSDGSTAQVEDVSTRAEYRGRGYARSTVLTAAAAARAAGCDLVFLIADEDDWPKELYVKLGFDPVGTLYDFLKVPPGTPG